MKNSVALVKLWLYWGLSFFMLVSSPLNAKEQAKIALIIDDMGIHKELSLSALSLPGAVTYSFLPFTKYSHSLSKLAYQNGNELMLHAPMQAIAIQEQEVNELKSNMHVHSFEQLFIDQLNEIPHISGVNNHKGSLLTQDYQAMSLIMQLMKTQHSKSLFFVDSKTDPASIAQKAAQDFGVNALSRDVFLDHNNPSKEVIRQQFKKLIALAQRNGSALGIAHPRINTLLVLKEELNKMASYNVDLVSVSELMLQTRKKRIDRPIKKVNIKDKEVTFGEYDIF